MENPTLKKIQKVLSQYYTYFKDDNILAVAEDKAVLPFCLLIFDDNYPKKMLMSIAVDYSNSINAVHVCVLAQLYTKVAISHPFYVSNTTGVTYLDDEAYHRWNMENINLENLITPTGSVN